MNDFNCICLFFFLLKNYWSPCVFGASIKDNGRTNLIRIYRFLTGPGASLGTGEFQTVNDMAPFSLLVGELPFLLPLFHVSPSC